MSQIVPRRKEDRQGENTRNTYTESDIKSIIYYVYYIPRVYLPGRIYPTVSMYGEIVCIVLTEAA